MYAPVTSELAAVLNHLLIDDIWYIDEVLQQRARGIDESRMTAMRSNRTLAVLCSCLTTSAANNLRSTSHRRSKDNEENIAQNTQRLLQETTFRCPEHYTGHYPTSDCKSYYWCSDGAVADSVLYSCNDGLLFDVQKERCDWGTNVDCNDAPYDPNNVMLALTNGVTVSAQLGEPIYFPDFSRLQCIGEKEGDDKPSWMTSQHMFKRKERCCTEKFSWVDLNKCLGDDFEEMNYVSVSATEHPTALPTSRPTYPPRPTYQLPVKEDSAQGLDLDAPSSISEHAYEPETPCEIINCERKCDKTQHFSTDDTYKAYDQVIVNDALYECKVPPMDLYCSSEGYEPGSGLYWGSAWKVVIEVLGCLPEPTSQPTNGKTLEPTVSPTPYPITPPTLVGIQCAPHYTVGHPYKFMEEISFNSWNYACYVPDLCQDAQYAPRLSDDDVGKAWWKTDECVGMQTRHPTPQPTVGPTTNDLNSLVLVPTTQILRWHVDYISRTCIAMDQAVWLEYWSWIEEDGLYYSKEQCCRNHYGDERGYPTCMSNGDDGDNE